VSDSHRGSRMKEGLWGRAAGGTVPGPHWVGGKSRDVVAPRPDSAKGKGNGRRKERNQGPASVIEKCRIVHTFIQKKQKKQTVLVPRVGWDCFDCVGDGWRCAVHDMLRVAGPPFPEGYRATSSRRDLTERSLREERERSRRLCLNISGIVWDSWWEQRCSI